EMDFVERHLAFLASTGSVSPYVGLFGTVWGIMHAFRSLANVQQATLAQVAPGIAEALVATAIGLFAAIPAVVAYNRYSHDIARRSRQGAEERARQQRGALGARGRRQERALRVRAPGHGRAAQAGNQQDWIAGPGPAMSTLAYFTARPDYGMGRAFTLAFAVH